MPSLIKEGTVIVALRWGDEKQLNRKVVSFKDWQDIVKFYSGD